MNTISVLEGMDHNRAVMGSLMILGGNDMVLGSWLTKASRAGRYNRQAVKNRYRCPVSGDDMLLGGDIVLGGWWSRAKRKTKNLARKTTNVIRKPINVIASPVMKVHRTVTRPISRLARPLTRPVSRFAGRAWSPMDRTLKKIPLVNSAYRAGITSTYASTGQWGKVSSSVGRSVKSIGRDLKVTNRMAVNGIKSIARPLVNKAIKSGVSETTAQFTITPSVTALATAKFGPLGTALAGSTVAVLIRTMYASAKKHGSRAIAPLVRGIRNMTSPTSKIRIGDKPFEAEKMSFLPSVPPPGGMIPAPGESAPPEEEQKSSGFTGIAIAAAAAAAMFMV